MKNETENKLTEFGFEGFIRLNTPKLKRKCLHKNRKPYIKGFTQCQKCQKVLKLVVLNGN